MPSIVLRGSHVAFLLIGILAMFVALSAAPLWFEQVALYSAVAGRSGIDEKASEAAFSCGADYLFWLICGSLTISFSFRWLSLGIIHDLGVWFALGRCAIEHSAILVLCWMFERYVLGQEPLRMLISWSVNNWCSVQ